MIISETFYNVECDCCGSLANDEFWRNDEEGAKEDAQESDFLVLGGKAYCPNCYQYDDDDNIITKDGKKYNGDTYAEIKDVRHIFADLKIISTPDTREYYGG